MKDDPGTSLIRTWRLLSVQLEPADTKQCVDHVSLSRFDARRVRSNPAETRVLRAGGTFLFEAATGCIVLNGDDTIARVA